MRHAPEAAATSTGARFGRGWAPASRARTTGPEDSVARMSSPSSRTRRSWGVASLRVCSGCTSIGVAATVSPSMLAARRASQCSSSGSLDGDRKHSSRPVALDAPVAAAMVTVL